MNSPSYKCFIKNKIYVFLTYIYFQYTVFNKLKVICKFDPPALFLPLIIEFNRVLFDHFKSNSCKMLSFLAINKKSLKYIILNRAAPASLSKIPKHQVSPQRSRLILDRSIFSQNFQVILYRDWFDLLFLFSFINFLIIFII